MPISSRNGAANARISPIAVASAGGSLGGTTMPQALFWTSSATPTVLVTTHGRPVGPSTQNYVEMAGVDVGRQLIADGFAIARYDSLDGYQTHPRQADYRTLDTATPAAC